MAEKEEAKLEVSILDRREITTFPKLNVPKTSIAVTYQVDPYPPRTVWIEKERWSKDVEMKEIRDDLEKLKAFKPETLKV